ncbi:MAG: phosphatase PAP2 family protein [Sphingomonadaceae bacterium]|nr:phosphatase PAP2 family protein [Sphingomonadaceae bacterium]
MFCIGLPGQYPALAASNPGYLADRSIEADLGYRLPPAPDNKSDVGLLDLTEVRLAQTNDSTVYEEAYRDAGAYASDQLMSRFSAAAGTNLSPAASPILAHILKRVLNDTSGYVTMAKVNNPRDRPYVEDIHIVPCSTDYLRATDHQSYPSGHAANGYAAALVLAEAIPVRASALLARGVRYGDNRIVCGVHHPSDVEQGRLLAIAIYRKLREDRAFREDVACAHQEFERSVAGSTPKAPFSKACADLGSRYRAELSSTSN